MKKLLVLTLIVALLSSFCAFAVAEEPREVHYFTSHAPTDDIVLTIQELAEQYAAEGHNIKLVVNTAADRAAYDQRLRTLVAGGQLPEFFEIDGTPYCMELADAGLLVDMEVFLKKIGVYDQYIPLSLDYQRLSDGRLYQFPLEFSTEMVWYNTDIFEQYDLTAPTTFDEWLNVCQVLSENGVTPLAIEGIDGWPLMRYIAQLPFHRANNDSLVALSKGEAKFSDPIGLESAQFVANIGQYFQTGFSSTDYSTAFGLFLDGKTAMFEIGTWELNRFVSANLPEGLHVDYFYMPTCEDAVTAPNDYWAFGGIGIACAQATFDEEMEAFITYIINGYDELYQSKQHFPARKVEITDESAYDPLFMRVMADNAVIGTEACKPWDVLLPTDVVQTLHNELIELAMGTITPEQFCEDMDMAMEAAFY